MPPAKTTKSKSRSKRPQKKLANEILVEEASSQVSPIVAHPVKTGDKRHALVVSDSEIEIIETPTKRKKTKVAERPSPGSPEFKDLHPVTISNKAGKVAMSKVARKLSFGSPGVVEHLSASETDQLASPIAVEEKRERKPSAKAKYMLKAADIDSTSRSNDRTPSPASEVIPKSSKNNPFSQPQLFSPGPEASAAGLVDDEAISTGDEASADEAAAKSDNHIENSANDSEEIPLATLTKIKKPQFATSKAMSKARDPGSPTIIKECHLEPFISLVNEAKQRGEMTERESTMPLYEMVVELLDGIGARNFKHAHNFTSDGLFVNPGKATVDLVGVSDHRVVVAGGRISIIFVTNGCVAACNLFIPGTSGSGIHTNNVKKIGIWPLNEEFDALTAYFGAVYDVSQFYCNFFGDILTFQTQIERTNSSNQSGSSTHPQSSGTPKKSLHFFGARTPCKSSKSATSTSHSFPPFLRFDEQVPVYDVRKIKFNFNAESFTSISSLPLYRNGISDLPQNAAVTVGYTVNTYSYIQKEAPSRSLALSLNIQFVILHGYLATE